MSECTHNCSTCGESCSERTQECMLEKPHKLSSIKKIYAVMSGKGGVGKSLCTSSLAVMTAKRGYNTAIMDADITGASIPKMFGIKEKATGSELGLNPVTTKNGIQVMSTNLLLENETDPIIWRGALISSMVKQFYTDVIWSDVDFMYVDMPPGTGDVPLTVFQSMKVDGIIIVTSPQDLVSMIVEKAVKMANKMNIPIVGLIENYSYVQCPDCGKKMKIFGDSHIGETCTKYGIKLLAQLPIQPELASMCDKGEIEKLQTDNFDAVLNEIGAK